MAGSYGDMGFKPIGTSNQELAAMRAQGLEWDPFRGGGGGWVRITYTGFDELLRSIKMLEANWKRESEHILRDIARRLRVAAQPRSPYLYGVLRGAHFDTLLKNSTFWGGMAGLVAINPGREHPILGGRPNIYGAEIHAGLRGAHRPWFAQTVEQDAPSIMEEGGDELVGIYAEYLNQTMSGVL
jgi:hypothetical protein